MVAHFRLRLEAFGLAYHERYRGKARLSRWLGHGTIVAGICTAVTTIPGLEAQFLTPIPAVITAITAVVSQVLARKKRNAKRGLYASE
jgi:hypothetical protein